MTAYEHEWVAAASKQHEWMNICYVARAPLDPRALKFWRERELQLPTRVRRMTPDALDFASGAWDRCIALSRLTPLSDTP